MPGCQLLQPLAGRLEVAVRLQDVRVRGATLHLPAAHETWRGGAHAWTFSRLIMNLPLRFHTDTWLSLTLPFPASTLWDCTGGPGPPAAELYAMRIYMARRGGRWTKMYCQVDELQNGEIEEALQSECVRDLPSEWTGAWQMEGHEGYACSKVGWELATHAWVRPWTWLYVFVAASRRFYGTARAAEA